MALVSKHLLPKDQLGISSDPCHKLALGRSSEHQRSLRLKAVVWERPPLWALLPWVFQKETLRPCDDCSRQQAPVKEPGVSKEQRRERELSRERRSSATFLGTSMLGHGEWEESSWEEFNLGCRMDGLSSLSSENYSSKH